MRMNSGDAHLTYCTNIHPGEEWPEVRENLERYLPAIKKRVAPDQPFGVGLRLSSAAARGLAAAETLSEFQDFLSRHGLYVFTLNGFPYGAFHRQRVKEAVYLPDWRESRRVEYTDGLAELLAQLLPDDSALEGSVSTVPGAFKAHIRQPEDLAVITDNLIRHVAALVRLHRETGRHIALAIEPEPSCILETVAETVAFFEGRLFCRAAAARLADLTGLDATAAEAALHGHIGVCLDTCHAAVEYEDPITAVRRLKSAGIRIAKLQLSAGLRVAQVTSVAIEALRPFAEDVYLHQTIERNGDGMRRYSDLPDALANGADSGEREWRIHFHVPIWSENLDVFASTQPFLRDILGLHRTEPISRHLEVETYTWNVLPAHLRGESMETDITRELEWVLDRLQ